MPDQPMIAFDVEYCGRGAQLMRARAFLDVGNARWRIYIAGRDESGEWIGGHYRCAAVIRDRAEGERHIWECWESIAKRSDA